MAPNALDREERVVEHTHAEHVREGVSAHVVPSNDLARVALDPMFTGAASPGVPSQYFSQLENLTNAILLSNIYTPEPVRDRRLFVIVNTFGFTALGHTEQLQLPVVVAAAAGARAAGAVAAEDETEPAPMLSLAAITADMRQLVDLPVQDLARLCGLGRRQYYNLLRGTATTMKTAQAERHIRLMHRYLQELSSQFGGDPAAVRSALLLPLDAVGHRSFYDIAASGEADEVHDAYAILRDELTTAKLVERLPPSGTFASSDDTWRNAATYARGDRRGQ